MKLTELFLGELEREGAVTRRTLARVPEAPYDWKPHPKSMEFGYLANLVAGMPTWVVLTVNQDSLDLKPQDGKGYEQPKLRTADELVAALDRNVAAARAALEATTDEQLLQPWKLLVAGQVMSESPRHIVLRDTVFNHLAHHRGQLTVYVRLLDGYVPSIYGPSADEKVY